MRKRIGYCGILLSYAIFLFNFVYFCFVNPEGSKVLLTVCLICGILALFVSLMFTAKRYEIPPKESKIDDWLRRLCFFPALFFVTVPCFLISAVAVLYDFIVNSFRRKLKALKKKGFSFSKIKEGGKVIYRLQKGDCIINIIPEKLYEISFDGGENFQSIADSFLGTKEERADLKKTIFEYNHCDYRDKDLYDITRAHVRFLLNHIKELEITSA